MLWHENKTTLHKHDVLHREISRRVLHAECHQVFMRSRHPTCHLSHQYHVAWFIPRVKGQTSPLKKSTPIFSVRSDPSLCLHVKQLSLFFPWTQRESVIRRFRPPARGWCFHHLFIYFSSPFFYCRRVCFVFFSFDKSGQTCCQRVKKQLVDHDCATTCHDVFPLFLKSRLDGDTSESETYDVT